MSKVNITTISSDYSTKEAINNNFTAIQTALDNTLSRDGTSPNGMNANIDMNSYRILNLPYPTSPTEPARYGDIGAYTDSAKTYAEEASLAADSAAASAVAASSNPSYPLLRVPTPADLGAFTASHMSAAQAFLVDKVAGDVGSGSDLFYWDTSTTTPLANIAIAPSDYPDGSQGCAVRVLPKGPLLSSTFVGVMAEGHGTTAADNGPKIQQWLDGRSTYNKSSSCPTSTTLTPSSRTGAINMLTGVTYDVLKGAVNFAGAQLDFENVTDDITGVTIDCTSLSSSVAIDSLTKPQCEVSNLIIQAPDCDTVSGFTALTISNSVGGDNGCGVIRNLSITGGSKALVFGAGSWGWQIYGLSAITSSGARIGTAISATADWNQEACRFFGGIISGANTAVSLDYGGRLSFIGTHVDGGGTISEQGSQNSISFVGSYFEIFENTNAGALFQQTDSKATLQMSDCQITLRSDLEVRNYPIFDLAGTAVLNGVTLLAPTTSPYNQCFLQKKSATGRIVASGLRYVNWSWQPLPSKASGWAAYPDADNANLFGSGTVTSYGGGAVPVRNTSAGPSGDTRNAYYYAVASGSSAGAFSRYEWSSIPLTGGLGRRIGWVGEVWAPDQKGDQCRFQVSAVFKDAAGNVISTVTEYPLASGTGNITAYTPCGADLGYVPAGTFSVTITEQLLCLSTTTSIVRFAVSPRQIGYTE